VRRAVRLLETVRRLRASQVGHRLVRRLDRRPPRAGAGLASFTGAAALPPASRRPLAPPYDRPTPLGWSFAGAEAVPGAGGLAWDAGVSPSLLQRFHAAYAEPVRATAERGDLAAARRWLAALADGPDHPYVRSRRVLSLVEARLQGLVEADPVLVADAAALVRRPEWDVRGNHLVANGAALVRFGGAFGGSLARRAAARGASILATCAREQVLADGVHHERSPVYHGLVLEHFLVALETWAARGEAPAPGVEGAVRAMAEALGELVLPDGALARFRDGAPGVALPVEALRAWAWDRAGPLRAVRAGSRTFAAAGLGVAVATDGRTTATLVAAPPCPRDLPAHGHADALAYEAVLDGVRVVAAAGTAAYGQGTARDRDRRPGAFAGFEVDGRAPADPYGAFRLGARAGVRHLDAHDVDGWSTVAAAVSGVPGVHGRFAWRRTVAAGPGGVLVVVDETLGTGTHEATCFLPLLPGLEVRVEDAGALVTGLGRVWRLACPGARVDVEVGTFALAFGATVPRSVLRIRRALEGPARGLHAWTSGAERVQLRCDARPGCELRVELRRASGTTVGWLRAGPGP